MTPNGSAPLAGSNWIVTDRSREASVIPAYAIVLTIVFTLLFLLGLLFLLIREKVVQGYVEVAVQADRLYHSTQVRVSNANEVDRVIAAVNKVRGMVQRLDHEAEYNNLLLHGSTVNSQPSPVAFQDSAGTKICPQCAETVKGAARVCRFCSHSFVS
jgi:hypothetical protein